MSGYHQLKVCVPNRELTAAARSALCGHWISAVGVILLLFFLSVLPFLLKGVCGLVGLLIGEKPLTVVLVAAVLSVVCSFAAQIFGNLALPHYFLKLFDCGKANIGESFGVAFRRFVTYVWAAALVGIIVFLKLLLLIVPGILAMFDYALVILCLLDDPELRPGEALKRSRAIMHGHRWQLFCLGWRFFGWFLLSLLTLGIGFLWFIPYVQTTAAAFYRSVMPAREDPLYAELPPAAHRPYSAALNVFWIIVMLLLMIFAECAEDAGKHCGLLPSSEPGVKTVSAPTLDEE